MGINFNKPSDQVAYHNTHIGPRSKALHGIANMFKCWGKKPTAAQPTGAQLPKAAALFKDTPVEKARIRFTRRNKSMGAIGLPAGRGHLNHPLKRFLKRTLKSLGADSMFDTASKTLYFSSRNKTAKQLLSKKAGLPPFVTAIGAGFAGKKVTKHEDVTSLPLAAYGGYRGLKDSGLFIKGGKTNLPSTAKKALMMAALLYGGSKLGRLLSDKMKSPPRPGSHL